MKKNVKAFIILLMIIGLVGCGTKVEKDSIVEPLPVDHGPIYNDDGTITLGLGYTAYGFYNLKTGDIIDDLSSYEVLNGKVEGKVKFQQNLQGEYNYIFIALVDYKQQKFYVDGEDYTTYPFKLSGESEIYFDILLNVENESACEFSYIIVQEPSEMTYTEGDDYKWDAMFACRTPLIYRINLTNEGNICENENKLKDDYSLFQGDVLTEGFELVNSHKEPSPVVEGESGENVELVIYNENTGIENMDLKVIAFLDWEQTSVSEIENDMIRVPENESIYIPMKLPNVDKKAVFHVIAFTDPYTDLSCKKTQLSIYSSFRMIINP